MSLLAQSLAAVIVSMEFYMEFYKDPEHELELLRLLVRGEKEIEAGRGYDLDAVLAEADSLLKETRP